MTLLKSLTSGRLLARNTAINFIGQVIPLAVAVFSIPYLIRHFGIDRFGILTLVWIIIGYFSLFDLGLGRALTQMVATKLEGREEDIPSLVWICLVLMFVLGLIGALILGLLSSWLVYEILKIPPPLRAESRAAFILLALSLPFVISTSALRGLLEAKQKFGLLNAVRIPLGIFMYVGPFLVLPFSQSLFPVVSILAIGRVVAWMVHWIFVLRTFPALKSKPHIEMTAAMPLVKFGGFVTISNIVGPLITNADRFLIGSLISASAVAYYTTPYEIVTKIWIVPGALASVLFPAFSAGFGKDGDRTGRLFQSSLKYIVVGLFPIVLPIVFFASEGLQIWLGSTFAVRSACILQWMAIGVFLNSFAQIPFALIQAAGKPAWTATLHTIQFPIYLGMIWIMIRIYGIEGAALTWLARVIADTVILFIMVGRLLPAGLSVMGGRFQAVFLFCSGALVAACLPLGLSIKFVTFTICMIVFAFAAWLFLFGPAERNYILERVQRIRSLTKRRITVSENQAE